MTMRERFNSVAAEALEDDPRVALVTAEIGTLQLPAHPRHFNVGIREQLMIGVAAGLALEGLRPVAHSYTPFLVERPYEQVKLDFGHQDLGAVLVSTGASYDAARSGRTHQAPEDVAIMAALPAWTIHVPGHPDELERVFRRALGNDDRVYIRMSEEENAARVDGDGIVVLRRGQKVAPFVLAVGPTLSETLAATADLEVTVAYTATPRPFDAEGLRSAFGYGRDLVLVEPYLAGTSTAEVTAARWSIARRGSCPSASRSASSATTARPRSIVPPTASTRAGSGRRSTRSCGSDSRLLATRVSRFPDILVTGSVPRPCLVKRRLEG